MCQDRFHRSTRSWQTLAKNALDTMKQLSLENGGSPQTLFWMTQISRRPIPDGRERFFLNNGQACIAGSRSSSENLSKEVKQLVKAASRNQGRRSQRYRRYHRSFGKPKTVPAGCKSYIRSESRRARAGDRARSPEGLERGNFVQADGFCECQAAHEIAREEYSAPSLDPDYKTEAEAFGPGE